MTEETRSRTPLRVLHLVGSAATRELDELSLLYARDALDLLGSLPGDAYAHLVAHVEPDGRWSFPVDLAPASVAAAERCDRAAAIAAIAAMGIDVALPQMFCLPGMTTYRSLLELLAIPFVGNPADVMALGAHKQRCRAVVAAAGVRVPEGELLTRGRQPTLDGDVVVKPASADNSAGLSLVSGGGGREARLAQALETAWAVDEEALVERFVPLGREVRCGIWERGGELVALPLEEYAVDARTKPIRDASDKLRRGGAGELELVAKDAAYAWIVDAPPDDAVVAAVQQAAREAFTALGCRHYGLFDFRIDPSGTPWFLEAGLYCSFAGKSVLVAMARAAGLDPSVLFDEKAAFLTQA